MHLECDAKNTRSDEQPQEWNAQIDAIDLDHGRYRLQVKERAAEPHLTGSIFHHSITVLSCLRFLGVLEQAVLHRGNRSGAENTTWWQTD